MGGFLRQSHPHFILLGLFRTEQRHQHHKEEHADHSQLYVGIGCQALEQDGVVITDFDELIPRLGRSRIHINPDQMSLLLHPLGPEFNLGNTVLTGGRFQRKIAAGLHVSVGIEHNHGYGGVAVDNFQHQRQVRVFVGMIQASHRLGPDGHVGLFLLGKVPHQRLRRNQEYR